MNKSNNDTFKFWVPAEMVKGGETSDGKRRIRGIASDESKDLQGEVVELKGIFLDYFVSHGNLNLDHSADISDIVGEPVSAKVTKDGLLVEGIIYSGKKSADAVWEHLNSLEQSKTGRKLGMSIEGKVLERQGNRIKRCWLKNIALTPAPVNTASWVDIAKSLEGAKWVAKPDTEEDGKEKEEKAMSTANAGALVPESLEGSAKVTTYKSLEAIPDNAELSFEEVVHCLQISKGYSRATAEAIADVIFLENNDF